MPLYQIILKARDSVYVSYCSNVRNNNFLGLSDHYQQCLTCNWCFSNYPGLWWFQNRWFMAHKALLAIIKSSTLTPVMWLHWTCTSQPTCLNDCCTAMLQRPTVTGLQFVIFFFAGFWCVCFFFLEKTLIWKNGFILWPHCLLKDCTICLMAVVIHLMTATKMLPKMGLVL